MEDKENIAHVVNETNNQISNDGTAPSSSMKRARPAVTTLNYAKQASFWKDEYHQLKNLRETTPERLMDVMKEEFAEREKVLMNRIKILEEELRGAVGQSCDDKNKNNERNDEKNGKMTISDTELSVNPNNSEEVHNKSELEQYTTIIRFYEKFTSMKVQLCKDRRGVLSCTIGNYSQNGGTKVPSYDDVEINLEWLEEDIDKGGGDVRATVVRNPQNAPDFLKDPIEFEENQCPYLMKSLICCIFKDDSDDKEVDGSDCNN